MDYRVDDYPSSASVRGTEVDERRYALTPSMREARRASDEPAGQRPPSAFRYQVMGDADGRFFDPQPQAFDERGRVGRVGLADEYGDLRGFVDYHYDAQGRLVGADRFSDAEAAEPIQRYAFRYSNNATVVEEEIMADGSRRFVREVSIDEFQAAQGPGNQPWLNNTDPNENVDLRNQASGTPSMPRLGDDDGIPRG